MRTASRIAVVLGLLCACGRTPIDVDGGAGQSRENAAAPSDACTDLCEQLACEPGLTALPDSFSECTRACEADRDLAASVSPRCARAHDGLAECVVLADCDELPELERAEGIATCRIQTDDVARHCAGADFELVAG